MHSHMTDTTAIKAFISAGEATFTLKSTKTGVYFTYKSVETKQKDLYNILLFRGRDNTKDYGFIGVLDLAEAGWAKAQFRIGAYCSFPKEHESIVALTWFIKALSRNHQAIEKVEFWHEGTCGKCGRKLTTPQSLSSGIGPECLKKIRLPLLHL